jgi:hypothetical protein
MMAQPVINRSTIPNSWANVGKKEQAIAKNSWMQGKLLRHIETNLVTSALLFATEAMI